MIRAPCLPVVFALSFVLFFLGEKLEATATETTDDTQLIAQVVDWLRENRAYVNDKVEVRSMGAGLSGLFAKEPLEEGEVVCSIPWDLILKPDRRNGGSFCGAIRAAHRSITKDPASQTPYDKYLAGRSRGHLPAFWSPEGKAILKELIGDHLPSVGFETEARDWIVEDCEIKSAEDFEQDESVLNALMIAITRGEGPKTNFLVPFHDISNHRNGKWVNAAIRFEKGKECGLVITRKVEAGEQLQHSYNQCPWCDLYSNPNSEYDFFVTPHMFEHYGFVEQMPQRWVFPQVRLMFDIDEKNNEGGSDDKELEVNFIVPPSKRAETFIKRELRRLWEFEKCYKNHEPTAVPKNEFNAIWEYHNAATAAFKHSLSSSKGKISEKAWDLGSDEWYWEGEE